MSKKFKNVDDKDRVRMSKISSKDTKPELIVRRILHRKGFRYRLHVKNLPGKPDIVFRKAKKIILVNGCFWHYYSCQVGKLPKKRATFWKEKLKKNAARDKMNNTKLEALDYKILVVWTCEMKDIESLTERLMKFLKE